MSPPSVLRTAATSPLERVIADVWATTLDVDRVGLDDDFFFLGGDSVLGAEVVARLAELMDRELPLTISCGRRPWASSRH